MMVQAIIGAIQMIVWLGVGREAQIVKNKGRTFKRWNDSRLPASALQLLRTSLGLLQWTPPDHRSLTSCWNGSFLYWSYLTIVSFFLPPDFLELIQMERQSSSSFNLQRFNLFVWVTPFKRWNDSRLPASALQLHSDFTRTAPVNTTSLSLRNGSFLYWSYLTIVSFFLPPDFLELIQMERQSSSSFNLQRFNLQLLRTSLGLHSDCSSEHLLIIAHSLAHPAGTVLSSCIDTGKIVLVFQCSTCLRSYSD
jgi:hypothetical protein